MNTKFFALALLAVILFPAQLGARILRVPGSYATIQAAINAAADGDTVLVDPGIYFENVNFRGRKIITASRYLLTQDPSFIVVTVIDGSKPASPDTASCVLFISGEDSSTVLQGFTLTGGTGTRLPDSHIGGFYREGGGILTENSSPTIKNNRIIRNAAVNKQGVTSAGGGAIRCDGGNPRILNNLIGSNTGRYGAGIVLNFTGAIIKNNVIVGNKGGEDYGGSGIWCYADGSYPKIVENNTIVNNASALNGGGVLVWSTSMTLRNNIIWGNTAPTGPQIALISGGSVSTTFCDVQGGWSGTGNTDNPPAFTDSSFYLSSTSPCVDAGDSNAIYNDPSDPANPNVALWPSLGRVRNDMGAYGGPNRKTIGSFATPVEQPTNVSIPQSFSLEQNYPNPFNPCTTIRFQVPSSGFVSLKLYDVLGRLVRTMVGEHLNPGAYGIQVDAGSLASGVYLYTLHSGALTETKKLVVTR